MKNKQGVTIIDSSVQEDRMSVFAYLYKLRDSDRTNMFGALPYIAREFPHLSRGECETYWVQWTELFD